MPIRKHFNRSWLLRVSTLILWVLLPVIVILYYEVYRHYWFVQLTGGRIIRLGVLILPVFYVTVIYHLMNGKCCRARNDIITAINVMVLLYVILSSVSIVANENNLSNVRIYSFYTAYPVLLYFSIQTACRRIEHLRVTMGIIFFVGVLFSIYSIYFVLTYDVTNMKAIESVIGAVRADVIGAFEGAGGIKVNRVGLPGPNATTYGSLLVLVILMGLWFYKTSHGLVKGMFFGATLFLVGCVVFSFTRGAMVSLIAALLYLAWKRFFTMRDFAVLVTVLAVSLIVLIGVSGYDKIERQAENLMTRFGAVGMADGSLEYRIESAQRSVVLWKSCPVIGCGSIGEGDHSYYTRMLASRGLVAFIPFMCFVWLLFRGVSTGGMYMDETVRPMMHTFAAGIVGIMVNHLVLGLAEFFYAWIWFGLVAAWINIASGMKVGGGDETAPILASNVSRDIRVGGERRNR